MDTNCNSIPEINPNPAYAVTPMPNPVYDEAVVIKPNPSYGIVVQPARKRQLHDCDYVVSDDEVINTDPNPSYVTSGNQIEDNPAYKPAYLTLV